MGYLRIINFTTGVFEALIIRAYVGHRWHTTITTSIIGNLQELCSVRQELCSVSYTWLFGRISVKCISNLKYAILLIESVRYLMFSIGKSIKFKVTISNVNKYAHLAFKIFIKISVMSKYVYSWKDLKGWKYLLI